MLVAPCFDLGEIDFEYRFNLRYFLETMVPRLAYVASRITGLTFMLNQVNPSQKFKLEFQ